eukprot:COSAG02_NODE_10929_length_1830_cov_2.502600_3_plen_110_part_00
MALNLGEEQGRARGSEGEGWLKDTHNIFTSGLFRKKEVDSQKAMLDKLFADLRKDSAVVRTEMDCHPDERRAREALDLKEVHVQAATRSRGSTSLRHRVARFIANQESH